MNEIDDLNQHLRLLEAMLFASAEPLSADRLAEYFPDGTDIAALLAELQGHYQNRGVHLLPVAGKWAFRTAPDLADRLRLEKHVSRRLSRAAVETLAVVAYHQPVSRAEIEEIRGVGYSRGTLDVLLEAGWVKPGRRRRSPGRPLTWVTTDAFLDHFGLDGLTDLPGVDDLKAAGLLDKRPAISAFPRDQLSLVGEEDEGEGLEDGIEEDLLESIAPGGEEGDDPLGENADDPGGPASA